MKLVQKFHLPHNSIRIDEFYHMLKSIDTSKEFYLYTDLRLLFLQTQIKEDKLRAFHPAYHRNLINHSNNEISDTYKQAVTDPSEVNLINLLNCQYTPRKTFKQVFNETVRDYTEFFAFLGLLPTYYKGKMGGEKKHFVTDRLKHFLIGDISFEEILLDFKYRNSSKDYDSITMYQIEVRPFVVALKACKKYFDLGFDKINNKIISAIVIYSKDENVDDMIKRFPDPSIDIENYKNIFVGKFESINKELGRATLLLRPYLLELGYISRDGKFYTVGDKNFADLKYTNKTVFCNSYINNISLTPVVGKIFYTLYQLARKGNEFISISDLFDKNISFDDTQFLLDELLQIGCIKNYNSERIQLNELGRQVSVNPFTDFFDIDDANYVANIKEILLTSDQLSISKRDTRIDELLGTIKPIALGSNGEKYEESFYNMLRDNFSIFDVKWLGANATGKRLSDIIVDVSIFDGVIHKKIAIIIECKAGKAIRSFDERKEIDDVVNTLKKERKQIDGIWYWIVNGDALPNVDEHGGYRSNELSKSFMEKLLDIQFSISEYMRVPTIVTAFSFDAISNYISYLYEMTHTLSATSLNKIDVPHFWRWSKKFMNLQYVMVHKELRLNI
jgi:hypothetical protein